LASGFVLVLAITVLVGSSFTAKLGTIFFMTVLFTLASYFVSFGIAYDKGIPSVGLDINNVALNWQSRYTDGVQFNDILAIFFPCYTGILSGADRSHLLQDPSRDVRRGTYMAILLSAVLYSSILFLWSCVAPQAVLQEMKGVDVTERLMAWPHSTVTQVGIIISSTSQCLQCFVSGSILLRNIAADNVIPLLQRFRLHITRKGEPIYSLLLTYVFCACFVLIGNLELVASLVSMCFLMCYASINLSTFILSALRAPNWRAAGSQFAHVRFLLNSFSGFILCVVLMFLVAWIWAILVLVVSVALFAYINYIGVQVQFGSGISGIRYQLAIDSVLSLQDKQNFIVNWRPQILCFIEPQGSEELLRVVQMLRKGRGMLMLLCVVQGNAIDPVALAKRAELQQKIPVLLKKMKLERALSKIIIAPTVSVGMTIGLQASGVGGLQPNCMLVGWPNSWKSDSVQLLRFLNLIVQGNEEDKSILVWKGTQPLPQHPQRGQVDVWWIVHDGGLMLLFAFLLLKHRLWRGCQLRIFAVSQPTDNSVLLQKTLKDILYNLKIQFAHLEVVELDSTAIDPFTTNLTIRATEREQFLAVHGIHEAFPETLRVVHPVAPIVSPSAGIGPSSSAFESSTESTDNDSPAPGPSLTIHVSDGDAEVPKSQVEMVAPEPKDEKALEADHEERTLLPPLPPLRSPAVLRPRLNVAMLRPSSTNYDELVADRNLLNSFIVARSQDAQLVIVNLPDPQYIERCDSPDGFIARQSATLYMDYLEGICKGLSRILLVHGTGHEIVKNLD
jgi:hypothetical protein